MEYPAINKKPREKPQPTDKQQELWQPKTARRTQCKIHVIGVSGRWFKRTDLRPYRQGLSFAEHLLSIEPVETETAIRFQLPRQ